MLRNSLTLYRKFLETTIVQVFTNLNDFPKPENGVVLTIGNFDGVHKGHQTIIARARQLADAESLPLVLFTFEPPPLKFFRPDKIIRTLTPLEMKISLFRRFKVDILIVIGPTEEFMNLSAEDYAKQIIVDSIGARHVVEGQTFSFGIEPAPLSVCRNLVGILVLKPTWSRPAPFLWMTPIRLPSAAP